MAETSLVNFARSTLENFKDKFFTVCAGALALTVFYYKYQENIDLYILKENQPYFAYLATVILLLSLTFIAHVLALLGKFFATFIALVYKEHKFYCDSYGWYKKLLKRINDFEVDVLVDYFNYKFLTGDNGNSRKQYATSQNQIQNLVRAGKIHNIGQEVKSNGDKGICFNLISLQPSKDYGKCYDLTIKEKNKREKRKKK